MSMNVDMNKIASKRSGITALAIWVIASLPANGTWWSLVAMVMVGVLAWRYMDLDHQKQKWRIEAGLEKPEKGTKDAEGDGT